MAEVGSIAKHQIILSILGQEFCERYVVDESLVNTIGSLLVQFEQKSEAGSISRIMATVGCELMALSLLRMSDAEPVEMVYRRIDNLIDVMTNLRSATGSLQSVMRSTREAIDIYPLLENASASVRANSGDYYSSDD